MALASEAHLAPARRGVSLVRYYPEKKRRLAGWLLLAAMMLLNELRGAYVVLEVLKAWQN